MSLKYPGGFITKSPVAPTASAASGMWTLDQAMQLNKQGTWGTLPAIGAAFNGGFFAGQISTSANGIPTHNLIVGPKSSAQTTTKQWKNANTATPGADSNIDGAQNTTDMVADGNATVYPAAHFCNDLVIGGFSDWYFPAKNELEVCYFNLKPTTTSNSTAYGINANAVPARASNYTTGTPAQTSATAFKTGGSEAFAGGGFDYYWSSTESTSTQAWLHYLLNGGQYNNVLKTNFDTIRAIRKVPV